jgi:hypothetical protein
MELGHEIALGVNGKRGIRVSLVEPVHFKRNAVHWRNVGGRWIYMFAHGSPCVFNFFVVSPGKIITEWIYLLSK